MFKQIFLASLSVSVVFASGCGYHSVNQAPMKNCNRARHLNVEHQIQHVGAHETINRLSRDYFRTSAHQIEGNELRIKVFPVNVRLIGFSRTGELASKKFEVTSTLDVVNKHDEIWSVEYTGVSADILHRSDPMWSSAAEDSGLRDALEKSIAGLHARYEARCRQTDNWKEKP